MPAASSAGRYRARQERTLCSTLWSRRSGAGALERALWARKQTKGGLIHHSDRGVQYVSIRYSERLAKAGIEKSVGSFGDSYDNAMAESIIGRFKTEVIEGQSWPKLEAVEMATLDCQHRYNHKRLLEPLGYLPPAEAEAAYHQPPGETAKGPDSHQGVSGIPGAVQLERAGQRRRAPCGADSWPASPADLHARRHSQGTERAFARIRRTGSNSPRAGRAQGTVYGHTGYGNDGRSSSSQPHVLWGREVTIRTFGSASSPRDVAAASRPGNPPT
jgi:hypothetical protein